MAIILIVEDDSFIRETAEMMIQGLGHHTLSASNIDEALLLLRAPQHIDALFTDIYLRPLLHGGFDLAHPRALRLQRRDVGRQPPQLCTSTISGGREVLRAFSD